MEFDHCGFVLCVWCPANEALLTTLHEYGISTVSVTAALGTSAKVAPNVPCALGGRPWNHGVKQWSTKSDVRFLFFGR